MTILTIERLKNEGLLLFECISGSRAYGLATSASDTDIKGLFVLPKNHFYSLDYIPQMENESHDLVYYELKRFIELLTKNNPNLLEMFFVDPEFILYKHPLFDLIKPEMFLSRLCRDTFAGYALAQLKRAYGLKKKILNPLPKKKKSILAFCYIVTGYKSIPLTRWLKQKDFNQNQCGLVAIPHMKHIYALFYDPKHEYGFPGIIKSEASLDVNLASVPKGLTPAAILSVNIDGYSRYCREYQEYWTWVSKRNEARYQNTLMHGKNYDAKNMMHTFRLLDIAEDIARTGSFMTRRPNREELLMIKSGSFTYNELMIKAHEKLARIQELFKQSNLPDTPDLETINELLVTIRMRFYKKR